MLVKNKSIFKLLEKLITLFTIAVLFSFAGAFLFDVEIPSEYIPDNLFQSDFEEIEITAPPAIDDFEDAPTGETPDLDIDEDLDWDVSMEDIEEIENIEDIQDYTPEDYDHTPDEFEEDIEDEVSEGVLSIEGVVDATNYERESRGLGALSENYTLNSVAQKKAEDMFERQYFAHTAPTGEEAGDLAKDFNYSFILVGENLAKGDFQSSQDLVEGWMNSPDHKENILNEKYEEIGIGLKRDYYEGQEIWMAVQIFGTPSSSCPEPDSLLLNKIEEYELEMEDLMQEIQIMDENLGQYSGSEYNEKVEERNNLADRYNHLRDELEHLVNDYNRQVNERNECVEGY